LHLDAVNEAGEGTEDVCWDERDNPETVADEAMCFSTPLVVHWKRSELSEALSLDESGLGEEGAMQLADLAGRGPRGLLFPPLKLPPPPLLVWRLLDAEETLRGMMYEADGNVDVKETKETKTKKRREEGTQNVQARGDEETTRMKAADGLAVTLLTKSQGLLIASGVSSTSAELSAVSSLLLQLLQPLVPAEEPHITAGLRRQ